MAGPLTVRGVAVVVVGYTLAPKGKAVALQGWGLGGFVGSEPLTAPALRVSHRDPGPDGGPGGPEHRLRAEAVSVQ